MKSQNETRKVGFLEGKETKDESGGNRVR